MVVELFSAHIEIVDGVIVQGIVVKLTAPSQIEREEPMSSLEVGNQAVLSMLIPNFKGLRYHTMCVLLLDLIR